MLLMSLPCLTSTVSRLPSSDKTFRLSFPRDQNAALRYRLPDVEAAVERASKAVNAARGAPSHDEVNNSLQPHISRTGTTIRRAGRMPHDPEEPPITAKSLFWNGVVCSAVLGSVFAYRRFLRRIPTATTLPDRLLKRRTLLGHVVSVGDADNFRFFHTPGGYLAGWGWLRSLPKINERGITEQTIHVRLDGIDAPEAAHFGKPAQKYSGEALQWLRNYVLGRRVRIVPLAKDQYSRLVAEARVWKWNGRRNVSKEMLRAGWCTVYEGKTGAEFNGLETQFRILEAQAKRRRRGIWQDGPVLETPAAYKRKYKS